MSTKQELAHRTLVSADQALSRRDFPDALRLYQEVFAMGFESWPMHVNAAQCFKRTGDLDQAFVHFDRAFEIKRRPESWNGELPPKVGNAPQEPVSSVFVSNLQEQLAYLRQAGEVPWFNDEIADDLKGIENLVKSAYGAAGAGVVDVSSPWLKSLLKLSPHRPSLPALGSLISNDMRIETVELSGGEGDRFFVIDQLFDQKALNHLLDQLLKSTFWFDARAQRSYLGAHLHEGLATPFMLSVAKALRDVVESLVGPVVVAQLWAFRYLANSKGIDIHADQGDWNLNVWPVSERHLVDTGDQGGMTIYDLKIGEEVPFEQYNSLPDLNRQRIEDAGAASHVVPYRGNRAVVFPSKYLHKTNAATFEDTFVGRRINLTLMCDRAT